MGVENNTELKVFALHKAKSGLFLVNTQDSWTSPEPRCTSKLLLKYPPPNYFNCLILNILQHPCY